MKKKIINICIIIISLFFIYELIFNKYLIMETVSFSLNLWVKTLVPTLFPFFVVSDILINLNITNYIPKFIKNFFRKLFNFDDTIISIFFLSCLSGFPSNARNIRAYYDKGEISEDNASRTLIYTHFANPLFVLSTTAVFFLHNESLGIILLLSLYLSNITLAIFFKPPKGSKKFAKQVKEQNQSFGVIFINSIKKSIDTILLIVGILTSFLIIANVIIDVIYFNSYNEVLIKGILEITMGLSALGDLGISEIHKSIIASFFITFGGISVHTQVISQLIGTNIRYKYFLCGRIIGSVISCIYTFILYKLFI